MGLRLGVDAGRRLHSRQQSPASTSRRGERAGLVAMAEIRKADCFVPWDCSWVLQDVQARWREPEIRAWGRRRSVKQRHVHPWRSPLAVYWFVMEIHLETENSRLDHTAEEEQGLAAVLSCADRSLQPARTCGWRAPWQKVNCSSSPQRRAAVQCCHLPPVVSNSSGPRRAPLLSSQSSPSRCTGRMKPQQFLRG